MAPRKIDQDGICGFFFCVIVVLGALMVICWLSITPIDPRFRITRVQRSLDSSTRLQNRSDHHIARNYSLIVHLQVYNSNKRMGIFYDNITLILHKNVGVDEWSSAHAGFYQGYNKNKTTSVQILLRYADQEFSQYMVRVETAVRFRIIEWNTKLKQIKYDDISLSKLVDMNGTVLVGNNYTQQYMKKIKT